MSQPRKRAWLLLPWAIALVLLGVVVWRVDVGAAVEAARRADWPRFALAAGAFAALWLVIDVLALSRLISRFHQPFRARELLPLRAASYVFMALSYDAAQAALGLAISRRTGISLLALGGTFLAWYGVDLLTIASLGSVGAWFIEGPLGESLRFGLPMALFVLLGVGAFLLTISRESPRAGAEPAPAASARTRLRGARLLATLRQARPMDLVEFVGWRVLFYASFVAFAGITLPAFGISVPWQVLIAIVPITMSIAALPVTAAGVGSTQVVMLALYGRYADEASILAYSLVYTVSLVLFRLPIGLLFLPSVGELLSQDQAESGGGSAPAARCANEPMAVDLEPTRTWLPTEPGTDSKGEQ